MAKNTPTPPSTPARVRINIKATLDSLGMSGGQFAEKARQRGARITRQSLYNLSGDYRERVSLDVLAAFLVMGVSLDSLFTLEREQ